MRIMHLNKKMALENINRLIEIDRIILDDPWTEDNFLMELKGKWEYSLVALENTNIVGFVICSVKGENLHIHRLVVAPKYQKRGIGAALLEHLFTNSDRLKYITVKTRKCNTNAQKFYERWGFKRIGTEGPNYVYKREIAWKRR